MKFPFVKIYLLLAFFSCQTETEKKRLSAGEQLYQIAEELVAITEYDSAISKLNLAFDKGLGNPMRIVSDNKMNPLIANYELRPETRKLIRDFCDTNRAVMIREEEPGMPITVKGQILDENTVQPVPNVLVELVHTDNDGDYFKEKSLWNPRIFAYLKTDANGEFSVETILPGIYLDDDGQPVPAHIHFTLEKEGYRIYASEFTFDDDPIFKANGNADNVPVAEKSIHEGEEVFEVKLFMQPINGR